IKFRRKSQHLEYVLSSRLRIIRLALDNQMQKVWNPLDGVELLGRVDEIRISCGAADGTEAGFLASDYHVKRVAHKDRPCLEARPSSTVAECPFCLAHEVLETDQNHMTNLRFERLEFPTAGRADPSSCRRHRGSVRLCEVSKILRI